MAGDLMIDMASRGIAVISDTHNTLPERLIDRLKIAAEIWHLGDVCSQSTIEPLQHLGVPLHVVRGNCDPHFHWPEHLELERHGCRFRLQHLPPRNARSGLDAILHGHLHQPIQDNWQGLRILSPGAVSGPRNGSAASIAWIQFHEERRWTWELDAL